MKRPLAILFVLCAAASQLFSTGCYRMYSQPYNQGYGGYPTQVYPSQQVPYQQAPIQTLTPGGQYVPTMPQGTIPTYQGSPGGLQPVPDSNFNNNGGSGTSPFFNQQTTPNPYTPNSTSLPINNGIMPVSATSSPLLQPTPRALDVRGQSAETSSSYSPVVPNTKSSLPVVNLPAAVNSFADPKNSAPQGEDEFAEPIMQSTTPAQPANPFDI